MAGPTRSNNVTTTAWDATTHANGYDSAGASAFIPEIWSGKMRENFYNATVFGDICNTDHEGEIKGLGDNVIIRTTPSITISDYEIGQKLSYEMPTSAKVELPINKAKSFAFQCDDIERYQMDINQMDVWSKDAGERMKVAIDTDILANIYADADSNNAGATAGAISGDIDLGAAKTTTDGDNAIQITKSTVIDYILEHNLCLDEQNAPEEGRFIVLPAWACQKIKASDLKDASLSGDSISPLRNGRVGMIDRTTVYSSNSIATSENGVVYNVIAGHKKATTFASQMTKMETLPNPDTFGQLVRGLNVYGYKVIDPKLLTHGMIKK